MPKIKTRDVVKGTIKKINKAAIAADRMRSAYVQTKEKVEHAAHPEEHSAEEYASDRIEGGVDRITHEAVHQFDKQGRKGLAETKRNVSKAKDGIRQFKEKRAAESLKRQSVRASGNKTIKTVEQTEKTVKQSARSAGKKTVKTVGKGTTKAAQKSVKTTIVICLIALICGSVFGVFFSGEDSGTGQSMRTAVQEINTDYDNRLLETRNGTSYDTLEMSGSRAVWKEVLAVYSVKVNTDPDEPMEVATMDDTKKQLLKDIFWEMNSISSRTESNSETVITETDDGNGNIVQTETTETRTTLYITVSHKTVEEMADQYGFNEEQREYLAELLEDKNNSLWAAVLYGIHYSDDQIVTVALSQVGNVGGEPYWSWYGFGSRVEWCACFVSWCANECGYIETGVIPKFAGCVNGVQWFKDRGQWIDGSAEPVPGMIIFFDWDNKGSSGPQDGQSDHVGIVQKVENGIVYTVEGNSGDSCCVNQYSVGHYEVLGYGVPQY